MFEFYDRRISHDVISARHFDNWWKQASRETPDLLNFEKSMLIKEGAEQVSSWTTRTSGIRATSSCA
nr:ATP-dependent helicase hrpA [Raoultella sp. NCTC 9187]